MFSHQVETSRFSSNDNIGGVGSMFYLAGCSASAFNDLSVDARAEAAAPLNLIVVAQRCAQDEDWRCRDRERDTNAVCVLSKPWMGEHKHLEA